MFGFFLKEREYEYEIEKEKYYAVLTLSMSMSSVLAIVPVYAEVAQQNFSVKQNGLCFK